MKKVNLAPYNNDELKSEEVEMDNEKSAANNNIYIKIKRDSSRINP